MMGSNGFSSNFPAGLRVLVVDADNVSLNNLEKMLKKCSYEVWTCHSAKVALDMLEGKIERIKFDIVLSDVNMSDVDGYNFFRHVAHNLNVPVIMMSGDEETSKVMKGIRNGACDYLLKPIVIKDVQLIWQHVYRKIMLQQQHQQIVGDEDSPVSEIGEDGLVSGKKKKRLVDIAGSSEGGERVGVGDSVKKPRVIWTDELHHKFLQAVAQIGNNKFGPKKILELMGDTSLTRENVASHLQKHRLNLSRDRRTESSAQVSDTNIYPEQAPVLVPNYVRNYNEQVAAANNMNAYTRNINVMHFPNVKLQIEPKVGASCSMYPSALDIQNAVLQAQAQHQYINTAGINDAELHPYAAAMRGTKNEHNVGFNASSTAANMTLYDLRPPFDGQFQRQ